MGSSQEEGEPRKRALIVEDDENLAGSLSRLLRAEGYDTLVANTLADAKNAKNVDVAIVDVRLPDGSGLELCRLLADRSPRPVIVATSGVAGASEGFELARIGAGEFVEKPFNADDILRAIARNAGVPLEASAANLVGKVSVDDAKHRLDNAMFKQAVALTASAGAAGDTLGLSRQAVQKRINQEQKRKRPR